MSEENLNLQVGDKVTGTVVKIEDKHVLVDIGYKTEGIIPISELSNLHIETPNEVVKEGDTLSLSIKKIEDDGVVLSKKVVDQELAWGDLETKFQSGEVFEVQIKEVVKGGLVADIGIRGFIPASLVEAHYVEDFSEYQDRILTVKIVELDKEQNRVILSHRAVVEEELANKKSEIIQTLEVGQVIEGTVQRITDFGVFVDIGGIDGLVHISQLSHDHVNNAEEVVSVGDKMKVEVLSVDRDNERIALSRKKVLPGPWADIESKIKPGQVVEGTVKRLVNFGAFIEVLPSVEGLVHISQIANRHIGTPQEILEVGQQVRVKVLDINESEERMSLSIRELEAEEEAKDYKQYEKVEEQSSFQFGDLIGDKLNKFKQ
ncbi:30S ribosomal protein S1 [Ornithinibacillus sp. BX22]|uniref:30S ribosomal protein S1 n=2 Tax=Ornithinibacillus TaxID=484508 RepID=A0A923RIB1_9BACI|nr:MULTISPECIES: 30S ribosomal protein S1 [Ornithinibacillus]MBC5637085.1 30S ribosomal protein S1 [Ornithinibacillus hominis]MBS3679704.1 30S ribosomal protein S1 [Ornithinibacillus massiliensis]